MQPRRNPIYKSQTSKCTCDQAIWRGSQKNQTSLQKNRYSHLIKEPKEMAAGSRVVESVREAEKQRLIPNGMLPYQASKSYKFMAWWRYMRTSTRKHKTTTSKPRPQTATEAEETKVNGKFAEQSWRMAQAYLVLCPACSGILKALKRCTNQQQKKKYHVNANMNPCVYINICIT